MRSDRLPTNFAARMGLFSFDVGTPLTGGTWEAAVAAQALRDGGIERVAILGVDYHHGNGTQSIFYHRADVLFASIHGNPLTEYPFFLGYMDETGEAKGVGCNLNIPLLHGTDFSVWSQALCKALSVVTNFNAQALVMSLGLDTYEGDPISSFRLKSEDYLAVGEVLVSLELPTVFVLEGGYALGAIGENAVNVLAGFGRVIDDREFAAIDFRFPEYGIGVITGRPRSNLLPAEDSGDSIGDAAG